MRSHNKILAVAITTALSASFSNLYAVQLYIETCKGTVTPSVQFQFENVGGNAAWAQCILGQAGEGNNLVMDPQASLTRPIAVFDFTGQSVVHKEVSQTAGVSYAAELFGGTGLILPTPITSGSTPDYLGVIYTIDGKINVNFEATFTLDNGATFAENPILGVRDDKGTGSTLGAPVAVDDRTVTVTGLNPDNIFRFQNHSTVYLTSDGAAFYQLGVLPAAGAISASPSLSTVYSSTLLPTPPVKSSAVVTVTGGLTGTNPATITVSDATKLKAGWTYACDTATGSATTGTVGAHLFTVTPTTTTNVVSITPNTTAASNGWATAGGTGGWSTTQSFGDPTAECAVGASIYRIHVPGDTEISLEGTTGTTSNGNYIFDVATPACNLAPNVTTPTQYQITNTSTANNSITITPALVTPLCAGMKGYKTDIDLSDNWKPGGPMTPQPPITSTASGKNAATFTMNASASNAELQGGDQLMLLYKLSNVGVLADPTQKVNMTIDLNTGGQLSTIVNPKRTVTVATSAKALDVSLTSLEAGKLNISVSSGSTQFSGESAPDGSNTYGYVSNTTARIGQLKISNPSSAMMADALTTFTVGGDGALAGGSKLVITGGQFQASKSIPGSVDLRLYNIDGTPGSSIAADEITMDLDGAWQATWNLDSNDLKSIAGSTDGATIEIVADGATEINPVENPPVGSLTIDFDNASYKDITIESVDLRKITKDGNVCTVYNVPPPTNGVMGADVVSIRVTNDSAIAGKLMGKFFGMDGGEPMWTGDLLAGKEIQPGTTIRLESDILSGLMGITWEGRGVLQISSTIPEMEVMALIRQNGIKFAPLSNLSTGARGTSCTQE